MVIIQWQDNNIIVHLMSNYRNQELGTLARSWSQKGNDYTMVTSPNIAQEYNACMEGIDLMDMLLSTYRIRQQTIKNYMHIFYYILGVNAWLLYQRHIDQQIVLRKRQQTFLDFHVEIADYLCNEGKTMAIIREYCTETTEKKTSSNS